MSDRVDDIVKNNSQKRVPGDSDALFEYLKADAALHGTKGYEGSPPADLTREGKNELKRVMKENWEKMGTSNQLHAKGASRSGCFVATVVYGEPFAPEVELLRSFRDKVLVRHFSGRLFVRFYYAGAGQFMAHLLSSHCPCLIPHVRRSVDAIVRRIRAREET